MSTIFKTLNSVVRGLGIVPPSSVGVPVTTAALPVTKQSVFGADTLAPSVPVAPLNKATTLIDAFKKPSFATFGRGNVSRLGALASLSERLELQLKNSRFENTAGHGGTLNATSLQHTAEAVAQEGAAFSGVSASEHKTSMEIVAKL